MDAEPVLVYRGGGGPPRADLVRSLLEGSGIQCYVNNSGISGVYPTTVGAFAEFQIYVRAEDAERAKELLEGVDADIDDLELGDDFEDYR